MAAITFYSLYVSIGEYIKTGRVVIGEVLVNTEFPTQGLAKLVTYLMIVSVVGWYCVTRLGGEKVKDIPPSIKSILTNCSRYSSNCALRIHLQFHYLEFTHHS